MGYQDIADGTPLILGRRKGQASAIDRDTVVDHITG
jgi:hypothetical protein